MNPSLQSRPDKEAARLLADELEKFIKALGINKSLKELGVIESELKLLARASLAVYEHFAGPVGEIEN